MPELPEVEATRRHLEPVLVGAVVHHTEVRRPRMVRRHERPADFTDRMTGRTVVTLGRRGKFLMASMDGDITWVSHLGMSGRFSLSHPDVPEPPHTNVVVRLDSGEEVRFVDPRTFGFTGAFLPSELSRVLSGVGRDALDDLPSAGELGDVLQGRTAPIKALLLDQRLVAGLGNIYADEVLHRSRIAPERQGGSLSGTEVAALRSAVHPVLEDGLRHGGTSLSDLAYLLPDGRAGEQMDRLRVYGRDGESCLRCGGVIERVVVRGRGSFWCRSCQR